MQYFLLFYFLLSPITSYAQENLPLYSNENLRELGTEVTILQDELGNKTLADVLRTPNEFKPAPHPFNGGYTDTVHWFRIILQRNADTPKDWILTATPGMLNDLRFYMPSDNGSYTAHLAGTRIAAALRPIDKKFGRTSFAVTLTNTHPVIYYLRLQTQSTSALNLSIVRPDLLTQINNQHIFAMGSLLGGLLLTTVCTLLIWNKDDSWIFTIFIGFILSTIMGVTATGGLVAHYLLPHNPKTVMLLAPMSVCLLTFLLTYFNTLFFDTKHIFPRLHWLFYILLGLSLITLLSIPFNLYITTAPILLLGKILLLPFELYICWVYMRMQKPGSQAIFYAHIFYLLSFVAIILALLGTISASTLTLANYLMAALIIFAYISLYQRLQKIKLSHQESEIRFKIAETMGSMAVQQNQEKSMFLNLVAHEIKTPLAVIDSSIQTLETQPSITQNKISTERHARIRQSIAQLNSLLENTLANERSSNNPFQPRITQFLLAPFIQQFFNKKLATNNLQILVGANCHCAADLTLLKLALSNLWNNAVKYGTTNTKITIKAQNTKLQNKLGTLISINNNLTSKEKPNTAEWTNIYYRGNTHSHADGLGIGLSLVKQIVHAHTGTLTCAATPSKKTNQWSITIKLWLPTTIEEKT
ncbi:MAG: two-component system, sensor histidine kinase LadS [Methyloprofundus sp.]|nr:MAG: two-component system, sensor histidine kinase LadS [Methyloprofundus sp.]